MSINPLSTLKTGLQTLSKVPSEVGKKIGQLKGHLVEQLKSSNPKEALKNGPLGQAAAKMQGMFKESQTDYAADTRQGITDAMNYANEAKGLKDAVKPGKMDVEDLLQATENSIDGANLATESQAKYMESGKTAETFNTRVAVQSGQEAVGHLLDGMKKAGFEVPMEAENALKFSKLVGNEGEALRNINEAFDAAEKSVRAQVLKENLNF